MLLAHDPRRLVEAAALDVQLVLSGHTHGGQVDRPGVGAVAGRKFPVLAGYATRDNTSLFVSRGVGTVYVPIRINCPPDVAVLTLRAPLTQLEERGAITSRPMPVSAANSQIVFDALKASGVRLMSALPETWLVHLIRLADDDPDVTLVRLAKEEEGVGISMGAHLAGVKSAMLMQNHGFLAAINGIVSGAQLYRDAAADADQRSRHVRRARSVADRRRRGHRDRCWPRCAFRSCGSTIRRRSRTASRRRRRSRYLVEQAGRAAADARSDVGGAHDAARSAARDLRPARRQRRRHDHGRGRGGAAVDRPSAEFFLPAARDGPGLVGRPRHRAEQADRAGRRVRRRRIAADESWRALDAGALSPAESRPRGLRQRDRCCRSADFQLRRGTCTRLAEVAAAAGVPRTACVHDDR